MDAGSSGLWPRACSVWASCTRAASSWRRSRSGPRLRRVVSLLGVGAGLLVLVFLAASGIVFPTLRPVARRHRRLPPPIRTGAAALVGRQAIVLERIANDEGVGCVKIDGEVWTARSYDEDEVIDAGERVEVVEIRGATALVMH